MNLKKMRDINNLHQSLDAAKHSFLSAEYWDQNDIQHLVANNMPFSQFMKIDQDVQNEYPKNKIEKHWMYLTPTMIDAIEYHKKNPEEMFFQSIPSCVLSRYACHLLIGEVAEKAAQKDNTEIVSSTCLSQAWFLNTIFSPCPPIPPSYSIIMSNDTDVVYEEDEEKLNYTEEEIDEYSNKHTLFEQSCDDICTTSHTLERIAYRQALSHSRNPLRYHVSRLAQDIHIGMSETQSMVDEVLFGMRTSDLKESLHTNGKCLDDFLTIPALRAKNQAYRNTMQNANGCTSLTALKGTLYHNSEKARDWFLDQKSEYKDVDIAQEKRTILCPKVLKIQKKEHTLLPLRHFFEK